MLSSTINRTTATGNSTTATYNYGYRIFQNTDLLVTVRNTTTNVEAILGLTTDYSVSGVGQASGSIALTNVGQAWIDANGFLATGYIIVIRRIRPLTQNVSIRNQSSFYASTHEDKFDDLDMKIQQLYDYIQRAVTLPETVLPTAFNPVLQSSDMAAPIPGSAPVINAAGTGWSMANPITGINWQSVDIPYGSFSAAATTDQIFAFPLPANCILMGIAMKHTKAFAGGSISALTLDLGLSGTPDLFLSAFDVFQAVADGAFASALVTSIQSFANATNIMINATSTSANLNALTQGSVRVFYWYMAL